ncbi:GL15990 [Drosophila persimilis]|uniref:GL15990 n=1 Tax=Drosophila persimilis TaxID=7234 RepID=B4H9V4_DROPE|nr:uncharacterized protein LOC6602608 [Drosophila persimilis]EDW36611.1 GL15990 [Drosophila persimilis]
MVINLNPATQIDAFGLTVASGSGNGEGSGDGNGNHNWNNNGNNNASHISGISNNMMGIFNHALIGGAMYLHVIYVGEMIDKWVTLEEAMNFCHDAVIAYVQLQLELFQNLALDSFEPI